ncbi:MAG: isocitrate/isopropylmalate family dehydrogenase [archaeon]
MQKKNNRKKVTCVHKANVLRQTCGLFLSIFHEIAKQYPNIIAEDGIVDATAMQIIKAPQSYDVIVTTNLFGDILSDEACMLVGGLGLAASGNIGEKYSVFEPVHGSAPKYVGTNTANPLAAIMAAKMMLEHIGEMQAAKRIENAVIEIMKSNELTPDLGGKCTTNQVTDAIIRNMRN